MKMENEFFGGCEPYGRAEGQFLPLREDECKRLLYMLENEKVSVLCSEPGMGKTSLIDAGVLSSGELSRKNVLALKFEVPAFKFGDLVLEKQLVGFLNAQSSKPSYIDMAFENDGSLWFAAKKLQACFPEAQRFCLIFDSFENFFTYTDSARKEFAKALSGLVYGEIPAKFNQEIQDIMLGKSDVVISKDGMKMLYQDLNFSVLFSVSEAAYNLMAELEENIHGVFKSTLKIMPFDFSAAESALQVIASQPLDNLPEVKFDEKAVQKIISGVSFNSLINPGFLRNAVFYFRKKAVEKNLQTVTQEFVDETGYFLKSRFLMFTDFIADEKARENFMLFVRNEMVFESETQPLPAAKTIALKKYFIDEDILDKAVRLSVLKQFVGFVGRIFYMPYNAAVFRDIAALKMSEPQQQDFQPVKTEARTAAVAGIKNVRKYYRNRTLVFTCMVVAAVSLAFVFLAFSLKGDAERNANMAKSNMLTAFAFQKLETDPTFSLRLAQKAVSLDTANIQAYSALLNSFYNTDIFYNISGAIKENVVKAGISNDAKYVLTFVKNDAAGKYAARILEPSGNVVLELPHAKEVTSITVSKDNSRIMTTSYDSTARVFDFSGKELLSIKGHKAILWASDISSDNSMFLTSGSDYKVRVWDSLGNCISTLSGHDFDVYSVKFSPDDSMVLSSGGDNTARLWTTDGKLQKIFEIKEDNRFSVSIIISAVFSPDGRYVLTAANDYLNKNHRARLFDLQGNELVSFTGHNGWINSAAFSSDSKHVITSSRDKTVRIYNVNGNFEKVLKGHNSNVWSAAFMPDNQSVVTVGDDHTIRSWTLGKRFETYSGAKNVGFACFSSDGLNIAVAGDTVAVSWDLTGGTHAVFKGHTGAINTARYSVDGRFLATASKDGSVKIWDAATGKNLKTFYDKKRSAVNDAVFSPDGRLLVFASDSSVVIRDLETDAEIFANGHSGAVYSVSFSPEGRVFVSGGRDGKIILHSLDGKVIRTFHGHDGVVNSVCFSPDGKSIISTSTDETAVLWDELGQMRFTFRGYENKVNSAVFSPDSKFVLTTSDDGLARLWTTDGKNVMDFAHDGKVSSAVFSPDGKYILTVYKTNDGLKTMKLRMISPDGITRHIDMLDLYGDVWKPDTQTMKKYGMD
jgi:WD40 repeat protein